MELNDIKHRTTKVANPGTNGFVERFNHTVFDKFFRTTFSKKRYASVKAFRQDPDNWMELYNYHRPHSGYHNQGRRLIETFDLCKKRRRKLKQKAA